jgi:hypothetical protein
MARHNHRIEPLLTTGIIATIAVATGIAVIIARPAEIKSLFESNVRNQKGEPGGSPF